MTKISIVMPVYNASPTLAETIESILRQTEPDFELVIVDDASDDDTAQVLARYAADDARVRVLRNVENAGITRSLIAGCAAAQGRYIARHDAGDLSLPDRLEKEAALLDASSEVAFVGCWTEFVGPELEHLYEHRGTLDPTHHGSVMFRRDAYEKTGGYRPQFYYGQDWDLWYRFALHGEFQMVPEMLYRARITPDGVSVEARRAQTMLGELSAAAISARRRGESEEPLLARAAAVQRVRRRKRSARADGLYFIGEMLRRNADPRARRYLRAALVISPWMARAWVRWLQTLFISRKR